MAEGGKVGSVNLYTSNVNKYEMILTERRDEKFKRERKINQISKKREGGMRVSFRGCESINMLLSCL